MVRQPTRLGDAKSNGSDDLRGRPRTQLHELVRVAGARGGRSGSAFPRRTSATPRDRVDISGARCGRGSQRRSCPGGASQDTDRVHDDVRDYVTSPEDPDCADRPCRQRHHQPGSCPYRRRGEHAHPPAPVTSRHAFRLTPEAGRTDDRQIESADGGQISARRWRSTRRSRLQQPRPG